MSKRDRIFFTWAIALVFFLLGMEFYMIFPKDAQIDVPDSPPVSVPGQKALPSDGGPCTTYQHYLMVEGTEVDGVQTIVCH